MQSRVHTFNEREQTRTNNKGFWDSFIRVREMRIDLDVFPTPLFHLFFADFRHSGFEVWRVKPGRVNLSDYGKYLHFFDGNSSGKNSVRTGSYTQHFWALVKPGSLPIGWAASGANSALRGDSGPWSLITSTFPPPFVSELALILCPLCIERSKRRILIFPSSEMSLKTWHCPVFNHVSDLTSATAGDEELAGFFSIQSSARPNRSMWHFRL